MIPLRKHAMLGLPKSTKNQRLITTVSMFQPTPFDARKRVNVPLRRLPKIRSGTTLLSIEELKSSLSLLDEGERICLTNADDHCNIIRYTNLSKSMKYIRQARSYERIIVLVELTDFRRKDNKKPIHDFLHQINQYLQVSSIILVCRNDRAYSSDEKYLDMPMKINCEKLVGIYNDYRSASAALQKVIDEGTYSEDGSLTTVNPKEKSLKNVHQNFIEHLCTRAYRSILMAMPYNSLEAKRQMLNEIRSRYRYGLNEPANINLFNRTYDSQDAINWYTRSDCVYKIINEALRIEDIRALYIYRYFIMDLCECLKKMTVETRKKFNTSFVCYRGSRMKLEEVQNLCIDTLVSTNGFWSTSRDLDVAMAFAGIDSNTGMFSNEHPIDTLQTTIFEIHVNFDRSPNLIVADINDLSAFPSENEFLFDLGTTFIVTGKIYDEQKRVWNIQLNSSSEIDTFDQDYDSYVSHRLLHSNGSMLYGNLLAGALGEHQEAVEYFQNLLRFLPVDDENRPNIHSELGRAYGLMGKYDEAKRYFRIALKSLNNNQPKPNFDYASTLFNLGMLYSELRDPLRAIRCYRRVLTVYHSFFPENHMEVTKVLSRLAIDLCKIGQYQEASDLVTKAETPISGEVFLTNPQTQLFFTRGLLYKASGNWIQALQYLRQALEFREKWSHKSHRFTAAICYEIALLYAEQDDQIELALLYAQRSLDIRCVRKSPNKIDEQESVELVNQLLQRNRSNL
ncbi:unnamed protein product [Rotaria socialis]|uniref:NAD(P)(+)--arginine ADP-ribosyltransferase n=1 Tax=Rotaria socialis TaxID=392032 RepID=A0A817RTM1_9BILA|nr:unnamed protein product [Rotaria socialis]